MQVQGIVDWIYVLILGGLCGALGQGARAIVGFKKLNDTASAQSITPQELVEGTRLVISFGIGFVVGALAATQIIGAAHVASLQQILEIAAAGYAGSDFLEGFISRQFGAAPDSNAAGNTTGTANTAGSPAPVPTTDSEGYAG